MRPVVPQPIDGLADMFEPSAHARARRTEDAEGPGLLASRAFWIGGACSVCVWVFILRFLCAQ
jgi:hypothetical protein